MHTSQKPVHKSTTGGLASSYNRNHDIFHEPDNDNSNNNNNPAHHIEGLNTSVCSEERMKRNNQSSDSDISLNYLY